MHQQSFEETTNRRGLTSTLFYGKDNPLDLKGSLGKGFLTRTILLSFFSKRPTPSKHSAVSGRFEMASSVGVAALDFGAAPNLREHAGQREREGREDARFT